ncbi:MAG: hypothetical protein QM723_00840 [Myxococcaceae bacterium]
MKVAAAGCDIDDTPPSQPGPLNAFSVLKDADTAWSAVRQPGVSIAAPAKSPPSTPSTKVEVTPFHW